jgi:hypothetical protein
MKPRRNRRNLTKALMINSQFAILAGCLLLLLGGCMANPWTSGSGELPNAATFFACSPSDGSGDAADALSVELDPGTEADAITLRIGDADPQRLDAVPGSAGRLFANAAYAWRLAYPAAVLTDVNSFQTYRCVPR